MCRTGRDRRFEISAHPGRANNRQRMISQKLSMQFRQSTEGFRWVLIERCNGHNPSQVETVLCNRIRQRQEV